MKKVWVAGLAAVLVVAVAAVAIAQTTVTNTYEVEGATSPNKAGKKSKPVPIGIDFDYSVGTTDGRRPSPIKSYSIRFTGTQVVTATAPGCSNAILDDAARGPDDCPAKSIVGNGFIENATGNTADENDQSVRCNASVQVINGTTKDRPNLYVKGSPNSTDPRTTCAIELAARIPAKFVKRGKATALEFDVPTSLLHPLPTLTNAVKRVTSNVKKVTKRIKGKKRGYFEAIGGCKNGKRAITVVFTPEQGSTATETHQATCKK